MILQGFGGRFCAIGRRARSCVGRVGLLSSVGIRWWRFIGISNWDGGLGDGSRGHSAGPSTVVWGSRSTNHLIR